MKRIRIFGPAESAMNFGLSLPLIEIQALEKQLPSDIGIEVYELTTHPKAYLEELIVSDLLDDEGDEVLPITFIDDQIFKTKSWPTSEELTQKLQFKVDYMRLKSEMDAIQLEKENKRAAASLNCEGGCAACNSEECMPFL